MAGSRSRPTRRFPLPGVVARRRNYWARVRGDWLRWRHLSRAACAVSWVGNHADRRHLRSVQPHDSVAALAGTMGNPAIVARSLASLAGLLGVRGTSRLLDRCLASQPPNIAIAASFPLAYGGRENDHCSFLRKHAVADEQPRRLRLTAARFELEAVLLAPPLR